MLSQIVNLNVRMPWDQAHKLMVNGETLLMIAMRIERSDTRENHISYTYIL